MLSARRDGGNNDGGFIIGKAGDLALRDACLRYAQTGSSG
jgi:hypothetical protein